MNLTGMLMALISIAIISVLSVGYYGAIQTQYGVSVPTTLQGGVDVNLRSFNRSQEVVALAERMEGNETGIAQALRGIPIFGEIGSITLAGLQILTLLFQTPGMFADMIADTVIIIGLPPWVATLLIAVLTILIIMSIVSALVKWGGSN